MEWNQFVSKILAFSKIGLKYSKDPYALENYAELQELALHQIEEEKLVSESVTLYPKDAYPTPNVSVRVLVFNDEGQLLMVQEKDDQAFCVPGGWCDVFESPQENAIKEVLQETGLHVEIDRVLGIFMRDKYKPRPSMVSEYCIYFLAHSLGGTLQHNHETIAVLYADPKDLPKLSFKTSPFELGKALEVALNNQAVYFD